MGYFFAIVNRKPLMWYDVISFQTVLKFPRRNVTGKSVSGDEGWMVQLEWSSGERERERERGLGGDGGGAFKILKRGERERERSREREVEGITELRVIIIVTEGDIHSRATSHASHFTLFSHFSLSVRSGYAPPRSMPSRSQVLLYTSQPLPRSCLVHGG